MRSGTRPLVLIGHGGSQHKRAPNVLALARRLVRHLGLRRRGDRRADARRPHRRWTRPHAGHDSRRMDERPRADRGPPFRAARKEWQRDAHRAQAAGRRRRRPDRLLGTVDGDRHRTAVRRVRAAHRRGGARSDGTLRRRAQPARRRRLRSPCCSSCNRTTSSSRATNALALFDAIGIEGQDDAPEPGAHAAVPVEEYPRVRGVLREAPRRARRSRSGALRLRSDERTDREASHQRQQALRVTPDATRGPRPVARRPARRSSVTPGDEYAYGQSLSDGISSCVTDPSPTWSTSRAVRVAGDDADRGCGPSAPRARPRRPPRVARTSPAGSRGRGAARGAARAAPACLGRAARRAPRVCPGSKRSGVDPGRDSSPTAPLETSQSGNGDAVGSVESTSATWRSPHLDDVIARLEAERVASRTRSTASRVERWMASWLPGTT